MAADGPNDFCHGLLGNGNGLPVRIGQAADDLRDRPALGQFHLRFPQLPDDLLSRVPFLRHCLTSAERTDEAAPQSCIAIARDDVNYRQSENGVRGS